MIPKPNPPWGSIIFMSSEVLSIRSSTVSIYKKNNLIYSANNKIVFNKIFYFKHFALEKIKYFYLSFDFISYFHKLKIDIYFGNVEPNGIVVITGTAVLSCRRYDRVDTISPIYCEGFTLHKDTFILQMLCDRIMRI